MLLKGRILSEHIQWQDSARNYLPQEDHIGGVELKFLWIKYTWGFQCCGRSQLLSDPISTGHGRNQPIYELVGIGLRLASASAVKSFQVQ